MEEIWKDIEGYEGYYQVSNHGRIKSLPRTIIKKDGTKMPVPGGIFLKQSKIPKSDKPDDYYLVTTLSGKQYRVHRLVAQAFIPNPENLKEVNHLDRNKNNNLATNLEWSDSREQSSHRFLTSLKTSKYAGVSWCNYQKKWKAQIQVNNKKIQLGFHLSEEIARDAYLAALERFGLKNKYATFS